MNEGLATTHRSWRRFWPLVCVLGSLPVFAAIQYAAYWVRFEGQLDETHLRQILLTMPYVLLAKLAMFAWFGVYQGWNRYLTFYDLITLSQAAVASSLTLVLAAYFLLPDLFVPRSVFLLDCFGTIMIFGVLRSGSRFATEIRSSFQQRDQRVRALIAGASDSGETLLRAIRGNPKLSYQIVGFLSGANDTIRSRIGGIPVLGSIQQLDQLARQHAVREVLITADQFSGKEMRKMLRLGQTAGVEVKVLPSFEQLLGGRLDMRPRTVSIEDLLRREPVQLDMRGMHQWIDGKVLLVTGSAGSIGSEICRQLLQFEPRKLIMVDRSENGQFFLHREIRELASTTETIACIADVADVARMDRLLREHQPDIIFHAAAYKHVPLMEDNAGEAVKNIVVATRRLADLADQHNVGSFVMVSTDKAVNPTSVMGACKRVAESYVQSLSPHSQCQFVTVRFGNVLDSAGSVVPIFRRQIAQGGPVTVTHPEMKRFFMTIPEASQLVVQAGAMGHGGEIFVLDMGEPVPIVDLATEMIHLSGLEVGRDIEIQFTGIRPGEKLYEELHNDDEVHLPTVHPKIMIADCRQLSRRLAAAGVRRLEGLVDAESSLVVEELRRIVPHYTPSEVYEATISRRAA